MKKSKSGINLRIVILGIISAVIIGIVTAVFIFAPDTTTSETLMSVEENRFECLRDSSGVCLVLPSVTGVDLDNQDVSFPSAFAEGWTLVVMPFDRDQQVLAITWLPLFQELAEVYADVSFYSIAALPDLNAGVRLLVIGGMQAGMRDPEIRHQAAVLFLENQAAFLSALDIEDTEQIQVFVVDESGVVYWRGAGEFDDSIAEELRQALSDLEGNSIPK